MVPSDCLKRRDEDIILSHDSPRIIPSITLHGIQMLYPETHSQSEISEIHGSDLQIALSHSGEEGEKKVNVWSKVKMLTK